MYEWTPKYGGLIIAPPPFNIIVLLFSPFYCCIKKGEKLKRLTLFVVRCVYTPLALIFGAIFVASSAILLPFAYVVAIINKINLFR